MKNWYVYMLLCKDQSIYTGITDNVERRFLAHKAGRGGHYTKSHQAIKILHTESFSTKTAALKREYEIKRWPKEKKLKLIRNHSKKGKIWRG